jgi:hypothetical protein
MEENRYTVIDMATISGSLNKAHPALSSKRLPSGKDERQTMNKIRRGEHTNVASPQRIRRKPLNSLEDGKVSKS